MDSSELVTDAGCGDRLVELSGGLGGDHLDEGSEDSAYPRWAWDLSAIALIVHVGGRHDGH